MRTYTYSFFSVVKRLTPLLNFLIFVLSTGLVIYCPQKSLIVIGLSTLFVFDLVYAETIHQVMLVNPFFFVKKIKL